MARDVFISYARKDIERVSRLVDALSAADIKIWWDREINPGESWRRVLLQRLSTADGLIVFWSEAAVKSDYVPAEARIGLERALLIPARIERCTIPHPFGEIQTVDLMQWQGGLDDPAFLRLKGAIDRNAIEREANERFQASLHAIAAVFQNIDMRKVRSDAAAGNVVAQSLLGHACVVGTDAVQKDLTQGIGWLKRAAEQGDTDSAVTLGSVHALLLHPNDWREAVRWYELAARRGHVGAALELAHIYDVGFEGVDKNSMLAAMYFDIASRTARAQ